MIKKIIIAAIAIILIGSAIVLVYFQNHSPSDELNQKVETKEEETKEIIGMYGSTSSYIFYPIDDDLNPEDYPEYMELDQDLHFSTGSETFQISYETACEMSPDMALLANYFKYAKEGNAEALNALFSDNYYKVYEPYYSFSPQMIYDINITLLSENTENGITTAGYDISYKIYRNNGTFRNDFGQNSSRTLYFKVIVEGNYAIIDSVEYYR